MPNNRRNNRSRDSEGRFSSRNTLADSARERPYAAAAIAGGIAAAGAFLWSRRGQIGELAETGMDRMSEMKSRRMDSTRSQEEISEEALTLKETGQKSKGPRGPMSQQDIKAGMATVS